MKKTFYAIIGGIVLIAVYLVVLSMLAANGSSNGDGNPLNHSPAGGGVVEVGVGEQTSVQVVRERWYGTIVETHYKTHTISELQLFGMFSVPSKVGDIELIWIHLSILFIVIFIIILCIFIDIIERGKQ